MRVPDIEALNAAGLVILLSEAAAVHQANLTRRRADFGTDVLALLDQGSLVPAADYVNAQRQRKLLLGQFHKLFRDIDCLFTPTTPITAPRIGQTEITLADVKLRYALFSPRASSAGSTCSASPPCRCPAANRRRGCPSACK